MENTQTTNFISLVLLMVVQKVQGRQRVEYVLLGLFHSLTGDSEIFVGVFQLKYHRKASKSLNVLQWADSQHSSTNVHMHTHMYGVRSNCWQRVVILWDTIAEFICRTYGCPVHHISKSINEFSHVSQLVLQEKNNLIIISIKRAIVCLLADFCVLSEYKILMKPSYR